MEQGNGMGFGGTVAIVEKLISPKQKFVLHYDDPPSESYPDGRWPGLLFQNTR